MGRSLVPPVNPAINLTMTAPLPPLIVAIDDETDDIFFLRHLIGKVGFAHRFQPFANGEAAMVALTAAASPGGELPLVCFLDIKMIGMSGFELLKWIRGRREFDALPVIMFSSSDHPEDVDRARELGAQGYLKKFPSVTAMNTVLEEAAEFAATTPPKKTFLQWSYRFIESQAPVAAK
jgi:CheY-like chemotaxis protein